MAFLSLSRDTREFLDKCTSKYISPYDAVPHSRLPSVHNLRMAQDAREVTRGIRNKNLGPNRTIRDR